MREAGAVDRREGERLLAAAGRPPARRLVASTFEAVRRCVAAGLGVALVPAAAGAGVGLARVELRGAPELAYCLVQRPGDPHPAAAALLAELRRPGGG